MELALTILFILLVIANLIWGKKDSPNIEPKPKHQQTHEPEEPNEPFTIPVDDTKDFTSPIQYSNQFCTAAEKAQHLKSAYWHTLKQKRLALANHKCESCNKQTYLYLHHVDYSNLLAENLNDVRAICFECHQDIHNRLGYDRTTLYPISRNLT